VSDPHDPARSGRPRRGPWAIAGAVVGIVLIVAGIATVGLFVLFLIAMSNYGSNK
jgi:hypothetical protein